MRPIHDHNWPLFSQRCQGGRKHSAMLEFLNWNHIYFFIFFACHQFVGVVVRWGLLWPALWRCWRHDCSPRALPWDPFSRSSWEPWVAPAPGLSDQGLLHPGFCRSYGKMVFPSRLLHLYLTDNMMTCFPQDRRCTGTTMCGKYNCCFVRGGFLGFSLRYVYTWLIKLFIVNTQPNTLQSN